MSGANAGRTTAGAAGIVPARVWIQIFMCLLLLLLPQCLLNPLLPACLISWGHSWRESGVGGVGGRQQNEIMK